MRYFLTMILAVMVLGGCSGSKAGKKVPAGVPEDFSLYIYHQGCRGTCPDYWIKVDAKGNAEYKGRRAVEMMGYYTKVLEGKVVKELVDQIKKAKFFEMEDVYGGGVADLPEIHTTITMDGEKKKVVDIRYAPQELKDLEAALETLVGKEGWEKTEEKN